MKGFKKLTAAVLGAVMALSVMSFTAFAAAGELPEAVDGVIKLTENVEIDALSIEGDITYDLNGYTLEYTGGTVSFEDHTLSFIDSSVSGTKRGGTLELTGVTGTVAAFNPLKDATINAENITVECTGSAFYPKGNAAAVNITNCDVNAAVYCVATNAGSKENYGVKITLKGSKFTSSSDDGDNTAVMINVDGTLKISDCDLKADRQALVARAGDVTVEDSTITVTGKFAESKAGNSTKYQDGGWQSGNEVPTGAVVVGNNSTGAYEADANVSISDCEIESKNDEVPAVFSDANENYSSEIKITGSDTVVTGSVMKKGDQEKAEIKIVNGTFTEDIEDYLDKDSNLVKDKNGNYVVMDEEEYKDYKKSEKKSSGSSYSLEEGKASKKDDEKKEEPVVTPEEKGPFYDVSTSDPNYDAIIKVYEKGWMVGVSDGVFAANGTLTRGMAATILWNKAGKPEPVNVSPFLDVTGDAYYAKAVAWAYEQGIVLGYDGTTFGPNDFVTTEQFTIMLDKSNGSTPAAYVGGAPNATRGWVAGMITK